MPVLPEYGLSGQVAIFATSGGDEAPLLASALAEASATVFPIARTGAQLQAVLNALPDGTSGALVNSGSDVSIARAMSEFDRQHDRLDILVNDARSMYAAPLEEISFLSWEEVQSRNVKMPFLLLQQALPRMAQREYGRVVNIFSELAERGMINGSAFAASQAALLSLTRSLAVEWGRHNIRVKRAGHRLDGCHGAAHGAAAGRTPGPLYPPSSQGPPRRHRTPDGLPLFRVLRLLHWTARLCRRGLNAHP